SVLSSALLTAPVFVAAALGQEMLRTFTIDNVTLHIARLPFTAASPDLDRSVEEFCSRYDLIPLALHSALSPPNPPPPFPETLALQGTVGPQPHLRLATLAGKGENQDGESSFPSGRRLGVGQEDGAPGAGLRKRRLSEGDELLVAASVPSAQRLQH